MFIVECTNLVRVILVLGHAIACDVLFCTTAYSYIAVVKTQLRWIGSPALSSAIHSA